MSMIGIRGTVRLNNSDAKNLSVTPLPGCPVSGYVRTQRKSRKGNIGLAQNPSINYSRQLNDGNEVAKRSCGIWMCGE